MLLGAPVGIRVSTPADRADRRAAATGSTTTCWAGVGAGDRAPGRHRQPGARQRVRRGGRRAGGGRRRPRHRGDRATSSFAPPDGSSTRPTWWPAGTTGRRADAPRRRGPGAGTGQRAALEAGERGGVLASTCDASAWRSRRLNGFRARSTGRSGSGSGGSAWPAYVEHEPVGGLRAARATSACTNSSAAPARRPRVGDDQVEVALSRQLAVPARPVRTASTVVPFRCEQRVHQPVDAGIVVHHQDPLRLGRRRPPVSGSSAACGRRVVQRQRDPELGATLRAAARSSAPRRATSPARSSARVRARCPRPAPWW